MAKILLVEDNELNRDMLSRRLTKRGHEVLLAADGAEAVASTMGMMPMIAPKVAMDGTAIQRPDAAAPPQQLLGELATEIAGGTRHQAPP